MSAHPPIAPDMLEMIGSPDAPPSNTTPTGLVLAMLRGALFGDVRTAAFVQPRTTPRPTAIPGRFPGQIPSRRQPAEPPSPGPDNATADARTLMERARAGDVEAFGVIYDRYVNIVFRYVQFRVDDKQLAEDLTADAFLRAFRSISSFTWQGSDPGAWLVTIARHRILDHFRSARARREILSATLLDDRNDLPDPNPEGSPDLAALASITGHQVRQAVGELGDLQRECIELRFLQDFTVSETAQIMNTTEGAIKSMQIRALTRLGKLLPAGFNR